MARAYLAVLQTEGFKVERVVLMVGRRDPARKRPVLPWWPMPFRRMVARTLQDQQMNHWPRELRRRHRALCEGWWAQLASVFSVSPVVFEQMLGRFDYGPCAEQVEEIFLDGLADPALEARLRALPGRCAVLYTGGGMVPASLLSIPSCRFLHVHPGTLPHVRGADGLLWSILLRGRPGATAFYMDAGLDTGEIVLAADLEPPPMPAGFAELDPLTAYRMLYAYVDPLLRAVLLRRVVREHPDSLTDLPTTPQLDSQGATFHFMNERLRQMAFRRLVDLAHDPAPTTV